MLTIACFTIKVSRGWGHEGLLVPGGAVGGRAGGEVMQVWSSQVQWLDRGPELISNRSTCQHVRFYICGWLRTSFLPVLALEASFVELE